ncbi:TIM23 complex component [Mortierella sp. GBA43]|nr:TIM23 complex component [Mortierella sp. GBA43]
MATALLTAAFPTSGRSLLLSATRATVSRNTCLPLAAKAPRSTLNRTVTSRITLPQEPFPAAASRRYYSNEVANHAKAIHSRSRAGNIVKQARSTTLRAGKQAANAGGSPPGAATPGVESGTMNWNSYFLLRRTRRNYERVFMVPCFLICLVGAGYYFAQKDFDPTPIFGVDQVVLYMGGTAMDKEFHKHIVRNRAHYSKNSARDPIPDYYGEKIKSVGEYRQWLRKQREYRRKSTFYV